LQSRPGRETLYFQANAHVVALAFLILDALGRNALSPGKTCWFTVRARAEQDVPDERMAVARAINS
jgi:hypothetical protein